MELPPPNALTGTALEEGRVLFNEQHFFEAHEVWEKAWRAEKGPVRPLLQGLIQLAAGYHKALVEKNASGTAKLLQLGLETLGPFPQPCLGLSLGPLRERVKVDLTRARAWLEGRGPLPFEKGPPLDRSEAPA